MCRPISLSYAFGLSQIRALFCKDFFCALDVFLNLVHQIVLGRKFTLGSDFLHEINGQLFAVNIGPKIEKMGSTVKPSLNVGLMPTFTTHG